MNTLTPNKNYLSPNGFKINIASSQFSNVEYFCTRLSHPAISMAGAPLPFRGFTAHVAGDRIEYGTLDIQFMISEYMENYIEIFNWMKSNHDSVGQFLKADIVLSVLDSSNIITKKIRYVDAFPVSLGAVDLHTQNTDVEYVTADASLQYTYFEFVN